MIGNAKTGVLAASCEVIRGGVVVKEQHPLGMNAALLEGRKRLTVEKVETGEVRYAFEIHTHDFSGFTILAPRGEPVEGKEGVFLQRGDHGAYVLMEQDNPDRNWVLDRATFHKAYRIVPDAA